MTSFERYAPAICGFHLGLALMARDFALDVMHGGSPITPELYGPMVYEIPALAWVSVQGAGALVALIGSIVKGMFGAWMVAIGAGVSAVLYAAFAIMARQAEHGTLVASGSTYVTAPLALACAIVAITHIARCRHDGS